MRLERETLLAGGVALWDASAALPRHRDWKGWPARRHAIERVYTHHSGALGRPGYLGLKHSAQYSARRWPTTPYHYWIPYEAAYDPQGNLVCYRANPDTARSYHTGGPANSHGVAVCWQGDLTHKVPSDSQYEVAEALYPWLVERLGLTRPDQLSYHAESAQYGGSGKPTCPGPAVTRWVEDWRKGLQHPEY